MRLINGLSILHQRAARILLLAAMGLFSLANHAEAANFIKEKDKIFCYGNNIQLNVESLTLKSNFEREEKRYGSILYRREDTGFVIQLFSEKDGEGQQTSIVLINVECVLVLHY